MKTPSLPTWIIAIGVILVLQTVSATLGRLVPVAGPAFTAEFGWDKSWVGYLAAANVMMPLMIALAKAAHVDPVPVGIATCLACSFGFMLPVSTAPNAIVFGSGRVPLGNCGT